MFGIVEQHLPWIRISLKPDLPDIPSKKTPNTSESYQLLCVFYVNVLVCVYRKSRERISSLCPTRQQLLLCVATAPSGWNLKFSFLGQDRVKHTHAHTHTVFILSYTFNKLMLIVPFLCLTSSCNDNMKWTNKALKIWHFILLHMFLLSWTFRFVLAVSKIIWKIIWTVIRQNSGAHKKQLIIMNSE